MNNIDILPVNSLWNWVSRGIGAKDAQLSTIFEHPLTKIQEKGPFLSLAARRF
jgi:hypothetical protein